MYAVIRTGGKQYKVAPDDIIAIEKLLAEAGSSVVFDEVLLLGDGGDVTAGAPLVAGASVKADVVEQTRGDKIIVFKKKRRKNYRRRHGHRQNLTVVRITDIFGVDGKLAASVAKAKAKPAAKDKAAAGEATPAKAAAKSETKKAKAKTTPTKAKTGEATAKKAAAKPKAKSAKAEAGATTPTKKAAAGGAKSKPKAKKPAAKE
jgi:large subunit ribosomal protein L21